MKVIPASYEFKEDGDVLKTIEERGKICYKSESSITPESSVGFTKKIVKDGHNSVAEMAVISFVIVRPLDDNTGSSDKFDNAVEKFYHRQHKFLVFDRTHLVISEQERNVIIISGSVRSFRETIKRDGILDCQIIKTIVSTWMKDENSGFYGNLLIGDILTSLGDNFVSEDTKFISLMVRNDEIERVPENNMNFISENNGCIHLTDHLFKRHKAVCVKFIANRAMTHEMVRMRMTSLLQESQRYCRYSEDKFGNEVTFIAPHAFWTEGSPEWIAWEEAMMHMEDTYLNLLSVYKSSPQAARTVLPNSCKTELLVYCFMTEWSHILAMRTTNACEPSMLELMIPLQQDFVTKWPGLGFDKPTRSICGE